MQPLKVQQQVSILRIIFIFIDQIFRFDLNVPTNGPDCQENNKNIELETSTCTKSDKEDNITTVMKRYTIEYWYCNINKHIYFLFIIDAFESFYYI